jgi:hypothetical protein
MTDSTRGKLPIIILSIGTIAATAVAIISLVFFNPPQCLPYTQPKDGNCIIGANIGLGLYLLLAAGIWAVSNVAAVILAMKKIYANRTKTKKSRLIRALLTALGAIIITYFFVALFLSHISDFIKA